MNNRKSGFLLACCVAAGLGVHAQSVGPSTLNAAGGSGAIAGNTYEWSFGEMTMVSTFTSANLVVTQGVLQPAASNVGIHENPLPGSFIVYPTPAENNVYLQPSFSAGGKLQYRLTDIAGKLLRQEEVTLATGKEKQALDMSPYASGNYMLQVFFIQDGKTYSSPFKIQKLR